MVAGEKGRSVLAEVSPYYAAENVKIPVLLLHGDDDSVVPITQSERMQKALKSEGADVQFIRLKDADHWLSKNETRIQALRAMGDFLDKHIGPGVTTKVQ